MFKFERDQITCRIGNVELGGQPGERPTVLIGSIFFARHKIVQDSQRCLLYTSDAADDLLFVDLGGRRIIKTKIFSITHATYHMPYHFSILQ